MGNINIGLDTQKRAAEKNLVFLETFKSQAAVEENGGTLVGSPVISNGITLNGSTQYVRLPGYKLGNEKGSIYAKNVNVDSAATGENVIFSYGGNNSDIFKLVAEVSGGKVRFRGIMGALVTRSDLATGYNYDLSTNYDVVYTSNGSSYSMFVNGVIASLGVVGGSNNGQWYKSVNPVDPYNYIGAQEFNGSMALFFKGSIGSVRIFNRAIEVSEALAYYNGTMWDYDRHCVLALPMLLRDHKPDDLEIDAGLVDGDMEAADVSAWTGGGGGVLTKISSDLSGSTQAIKLTGNNGYFTQAISVSGKKVKVTGYAKSDGLSIPELREPVGAAKIWIGTTTTTWQYFEVEFIPGNNFSPLFWCLGGSYVEFDNVTVTELQSYTKDRSGNGNDAIFGGGVVAAYPTFSDGKYTFDGNDDYMDTKSSTLVANTEQITVAALFCNKDIITNSRTLVSHGSAVGGNSWFFQNSAASADPMQFRVTIGGSLKDARLGIRKNEIAFLCGTHDLNVVRLYDGNNVAETAAVGNRDACTTNVLIGEDGYGTNFLGDLYCVFIYNTALNPTQILDLQMRMEENFSLGRRGI